MTLRYTISDNVFLLQIPGDLLMLLLRKNCTKMAENLLQKRTEKPPFSSNKRLFQHSSYFPIFECILLPKLYYLKTFFWQEKTFYVKDFVF